MDLDDHRTYMPIVFTGIRPYAREDPSSSYLSLAEAIVKSSGTAVSVTASAAANGARG